MNKLGQSYCKVQAGKTYNEGDDEEAESDYSQTFPPREPDSNDASSKLPRSSVEGIRDPVSDE